MNYRLTPFSANRILRTGLFIRPVCSAEVNDQPSTSSSGQEVWSHTGENRKPFRRGQFNLRFPLARSPGFSFLTRSTRRLFQH